MRVKNECQGELSRTPSRADRAVCIAVDQPMAVIQNLRGRLLQNVLTAYEQHICLIDRRTNAVPLLCELNVSQLTDSHGPHTCPTPLTGVRSGHFGHCELITSKPLCHSASESACLSWHSFIPTLLKEAPLHYQLIAQTKPGQELPRELKTGVRIADQADCASSLTQLNPALHSTMSFADFARADRQAGRLPEAPRAG